jgi:uncharacterized protein YqjF (DUF2071 family)
VEVEAFQTIPATPNNSAVTEIPANGMTCQNCARHVTEALAKMTSDNPKVFLTAKWQYLAMLNYEIEPAILAPLVPQGTELDSFGGKTFVSVVAFLFLNARVGGISIPFHKNFEEFNLRFYVRRKAGDGWRRGVVFIKELVPRVAIAFVARKFYNENYIALPMSHRIEKVGEEVQSVSYAWQFNNRENILKLTVQGLSQPLVDGSVQEFITEHYWGYAKQRDGSTMEYRVEHPRWRVWETKNAELFCQIANLFDDRFGQLLSQPPASAFLADGSEVKVYKGVRLPV